MIAEDKIPADTITNFTETGEIDYRTVIYTKTPEVLKWDSDKKEWTWKYELDTFDKFFSGDFLPKFFDYAMVRYEDKIRVKFQSYTEEEKAEIGCAIDILSGSTIKGARFNTDFESSDVFLNNLAFRVQPLEEYYDNTHSYSQNGDSYTVGYDKDFYDGKLEYTANGYPPQSFSWKLSRSRSTSVVATALTIAGALIGSWAF